MKIVVDDKIPYMLGPLTQLREMLAARGEPLQVLAKSGGDIQPVDVRDAEILIVRTRTRCDAHLLQGSAVRLVVTATIGYDHLDTPWLDAAGIRWTNCPGCNATSVAQYVCSCLIATCSPSDITLGIIGVGHVGRAVACAAQKIGVGRILLNDPPLEQQHAAPPSGLRWSSLTEVLTESDVVTLHTPLTVDGPHPTLHLLDAEAFVQMERQPTVINAARGGVVDEEALLHALDSGLVSAAIIDTWEGEPAINLTLLERAVIATPHIAGYSADGKVNATRMSMAAVADYLHLPDTFDIHAPRLPHFATEVGSPVGAPYHSDMSAAELQLWLYDPRRDSARLKASPATFEAQRGHYPLRREVVELA